MNKSNHKVIAHILAFFTAILWGTTFVSTKILLKEFTPITILFVRFVIAYVALWIVHPKRYRLKGFKEEFWLFFEGIFGVSLYFFCENVALLNTFASNVGVIVSTAPMFTAIIASVFLKEERPNKYFYIGFICSIVGISCISFQGQQKFQINPVGDLLAVFAGICWAIYSVVMKKHVDLKTDMLGATRRIIFYAIVTMIPFCFLTDYHLEMESLLKPVMLANLLYLGILASALCYLIWNYAVEHLGAVTSSIYIYIVPVITIVTSILVLKEPFTLLIGFGAGLTIAGLFISGKKDSKKMLTDGEQRDTLPKY